METEPARALNGEQVGHICDSCNARVRTGDKVRGYATWYNGDGWVLRRLWCGDCGGTVISEGTEGADEVVFESVFWEHRLAGVNVTDRSTPEEYDE
jgi:hypothetical protein